MRTLLIALTVLTALSQPLAPPANAWPWPRGKSGAEKTAPPQDESAPVAKSAATAAKSTAPVQSSEPAKSAVPAKPAQPSKPATYQSKPGEHLFGDDDEIEVKPAARAPRGKLFKPKAGPSAAIQNLEQNDAQKPEQIDDAPDKNGGAANLSSEEAANPGPDEQGELKDPAAPQSFGGGEFDKSEAAQKRREMQRTAVLKEQQKQQKGRKHQKKEKAIRDDHAPNSAAGAGMTVKLGKEKDDPHVYEQTDRSNGFTYTLPVGWQATKNPMYAHDILVKKGKESRGSLVIDEKEAKGGLARLTANLAEDLPKHCEDFALVSKEITRLSNGATCARVIHNGKVEKSEFCQVNYILPYTHKHVLVITGTVARADAERELGLFESFVSSIKVKKRLIL